MFHPEDFERHLVNVLTAARTETPSLDVKHVGVVDDTDITLDNFAEYFKSHPAILVGVGDDTAEETVGARADSNILAVEVDILLLVQSKAKKGGLQAAARPILRRIKDKLRGLRWTAANGAQDNNARLYYQGTETVATAGGVALYLQSYQLKTLDTNDTRRSL